MAEIFSGRIPGLIAAFLTALRMKGETVMRSRAARAMRGRQPVYSSPRSWSTVRDRRRPEGSFNISTARPRRAGAGSPWRNTATARFLPCAARHVLEAGSSRHRRAERCLKEGRYRFLFAHSTTRHEARHARSQGVGRRTIFKCWGPLQPGLRHVQRSAFFRTHAGYDGRCSCGWARHSVILHGNGHDEINPARTSRC